MRTTAVTTRMLAVVVLGEKPSDQLMEAVVVVAVVVTLLLAIVGASMIAIKVVAAVAVVVVVAFLMEYVGWLKGKECQQVSGMIASAVLVGLEGGAFLPLIPGSGAGQRGGSGAGGAAQHLQDYERQDPAVQVGECGAGEALRGAGHHHTTMRGPAMALVVTITLALPLYLPLRGLSSALPFHEAGASRATWTGSSRPCTTGRQATTSRRQVGS